jgi:hypothetical protein
VRDETLFYTIALIRFALIRANSRPTDLICAHPRKPAAKCILAVEPARTGTARIAACAAWAATSQCRAFLTAAHGKTGNLLFQLFAFAFGASGLLSVEDDAFEVVVALATNIFKNRHGIHIIRTNLTTDDTDFTDLH